MARAWFEHDVALLDLGEQHDEPGEIERRRKLLLADLVFAAHRLRRQSVHKLRKGGDRCGIGRPWERERVPGHRLLEQLEAVALGSATLGVCASEQGRGLGVQDFAVYGAGGDMMRDIVDRSSAAIVLMREEVRHL
jgi:hypothetical protein